MSTQAFAQIAMNTIPTTFSDSLPSYTAVGGTERLSSTGLSAVVLNRGGRQQRYSLFDELGKSGFDYVLSMEGSASRYDLEALSGDFPFVRFILLKEDVSPGEEINLAALELSSPLFFVIWNDSRILRGGVAGRIAERLQNYTQGGESTFTYKRICTVPLIQNGRAETMPTLITPVLISEKPSTLSIKTIPSYPGSEGLQSLYPFDGVGIYDRERFVRLGGFDSSIKSFRWQLMDFGFRCSLWGEKIESTQLVKIAYEGDIPQEDGTAESGFKRFSLKNLAPVFRGDYAHIPLRRFLWYWRKMGSGLTEAWKEFSAARLWVEINRYRFCSDARTIVERWESLGALGGTETGAFVEAASESETAQKEKG